MLPAPGAGCVDVGVMVAVVVVVVVGGGGTPRSHSHRSLPRATLRAAEVSKDPATAQAQCAAFEGTLTPQMCKDIGPYHTMKTDTTGHSPITASGLTCNNACMACHPALACHPPV